MLLPLNVSGARVRVAEVAARPTADAVDTILACVTSKTKLLAVSHVLWTTGQALPVGELKERTGLPVLVDGAQSVGAMPVDVGAIDFYTVSCQKWLCGPEPLGALYVREPEGLNIAIPSYFAQQSIERDGTFVPTNGAARFDSGWLATPALAGLEAALAEAPDGRYERAAEIAARAAARLRERYEVVSATEKATLVSFVPPGEPAAAAASLYDAGVVVRELPGTGWLRASCGWWTNEDDVDRLLAALAG